jgi:hypothetical protein
MSVTIATGTQASIASTYGSSVNMTAITNATEAVATLAVGHGVVVGDFLEVTSGWDLLNNRIVRIKTVATNDVTMETIDTSSTSNYPAGSGTGSIRRITAWTSITQIQQIQTSGGDLDFADITSIVDRVKKQVPTVRSAIQIDLTVFDDPSLGWYNTVRTASETFAATALRLVFPNASRMVANGYYSLQTTPNVASNSPLTAGIGFSALATPTRYST